MTTVSRLLTASLLGALALASAAEARADQKQECSAAYVATQSLRDEDKLLDAQRQALVCIDAACPAFIREDCARWLAEIEALTPTIVFKAEDASGAAAPGVHLKVDGRAIPDWFIGKPVPLDPGEHQVSFEREGSDPINLSILARKGEKNRKVVASFKRPAAIP